MKIRSILTLTAAIGLFVMTPGHQVQAITLAGEAVGELNSAKKSDHPIDHLVKAKHHLQETEHVERIPLENALTHIDEAIDAARKRQVDRMQIFIERALHDIQDGKR